MKYSVDSSSFIHAWRKNYPIDWFPGFWEDMESLIESGDVRSTDEVQMELERQDDELLAWLTDRPDVFIPIDDPVQDAVAVILASHPTLIDARRGRSGADPWVIALAQVNGCKVVCEERPTASPQRPHIPDVCAALRVPCITILDVIKECGFIYK